jgi:hypothetical protein
MGSLNFTDTADVTLAQFLAGGAQGRAGVAGDLHAPTSNTAAVVTYTATPSVKHVISGVYWSYNAAPTAGNLKIEDVSGTTIFSVDITAAGPGFMPFPTPFKSAVVNTAMIVTLAAGGSGVTGKVTARHWTES